MQIKEIKRKSNVNCWEFSRWTYDATKARSVQTVLGRMNCTDDTIPNHILDKCTDVEIADLEEWLVTTLEGRKRDALSRVVTEFMSDDGEYRRLKEALNLNCVSADDMNLLSMALSELTEYALLKTQDNQVGKPHEIIQAA